MKTFSLARTLMLIIYLPVSTKNSFKCQKKVTQNLENHSTEWSMYVCFDRKSSVFIPLESIFEKHPNATGIMQWNAKKKKNPGLIAYMIYFRKTFIFLQIIYNCDQKFDGKDYLFFFRSFVSRCARCTNSVVSQRSAAWKGLEVNVIRIILFEIY